MALGYQTFTTPAGNLAPAIHGSSFDAPFNNMALFTGSCADGEYRQRVKGVFKVDGSAITHVLCGAVHLQMDVYNEDGCPPNGCTAYGYRACPDDPHNQYTPNRANGCSFSMYDAPGFKNISANRTYEINLSFEGKLIDKSRGNTALATQYWTVQGTTPVHEVSAMPSTAALGSNDKLVSAHTSINATTGVLELHIVVTRPGGSPGIDPTSLSKLTLIDATGQRTVLDTVPAVHEVGNDRRTTASLVYTLAHGATPPVQVELQVNRGTVTLRVQSK